MDYSQSDYERERALVDKADAYWKANATYSKGGWSSMSKELSAHPDYAAVNNAMRGRVEHFEFMRDKPERYVAYLSSDERTITTCTGQPFGAFRLGNKWRSNFGDMRRAGRATIDGTEYSVLAFGGGMYCHLRKLKG